MAETGKNTLFSMPNRLLDYVLVEDNDSVQEFMSRVEEQIRVLKLAIENGSVNDVRKAWNFAQKARRFIELPYFHERKNLRKSVRIMKNDFKIFVLADKEISVILANWIAKKRNHKIIFAEENSPFAKEVSRIQYSKEYERFYSTDLDFLNEAIAPFVSEQILIKYLFELYNDKCFINGLGCKNSWKVSTLKEKLLETLGQSDEEKRQRIQAILSLGYFKYKKFLDSTVKELIKVAQIRYDVLLMVIAWLNERISVAKQLKGVLPSIEADSTMVFHFILKRYDESIKLLTDKKKLVDEEYSLYRFGQGLIEADIFAPLYK